MAGKLNVNIVVCALLIALGGNAAAREAATQESHLYVRVLDAVKDPTRNDLTDPEYDSIEAYISQGKSNWIAFYPVLKKPPFSGVVSFQEALDISMAYALSNNAAYTLRFVNEDNINIICGVPFIEPTASMLNQYYLKTKEALKAREQEEPCARRCLMRLNKVMQNIRMIKPD